MKKERKCESYTIFDNDIAGEVEVVIGHSLTAVQPYATWKTYEHTGYTVFQHGNYFDSLQAARIDYYDRLKEAWENYHPAKNKKQERGEQNRGKAR
ncbi:MAG: hypothetical protein IJU66_00630 [Oscillospiraceae bacterium]|nr:hypothetical protein [Oscillospiraceae bacterium]